MLNIKNVVLFACMLLSFPLAALEKPLAPIIPVKNVGIVNLMDAEISNLHIGFTVFGNFQTKKPDTWGMPDYANQQIVSQLAEQHISAVLISPPVNIVDALKKELYWTWNGNLNVKKAGAIKQYMENEKLDAIIELRSRALEDLIGGTSVMVAGHGLYTHGSIEKPRDVVVYTMYMATIIYREPFTGSKGNQCLLADRITLPDAIGAPLESLSLQQMEFIRPYLQSQFNLMIERLLTTGRMSTKAIPECPKFK